MMFVAQRRIEIIRFGERGAHSPTPSSMIGRVACLTSPCFGRPLGQPTSPIHECVRSGYSHPSGVSLLRAKAPLMITAKDTPRQIPWGRFTLAKQ
jgi:hypothetical protein